MLKKILPFTALIALLVFLSSTDILPSTSTLTQRQKININQDWQYIEDSQTKISEIDNAEGWQAIDLPHTWNQWDAVDNSPGYRRDASWYRKEMKIPSYDQAQYILYFEGVNISSTVYLNGTEVGGHIGGYVGFEIDVTDHIKKDQQNTIDIRVDNSYNRDVVPSQKADFFIYGGITRDVWLKILPNVNFKNIQISTPDVSAKSADTEVVIDFHNAGSLGRNHQVKCQIIDPSTSEVVAEKTIKANKAKKGKCLKLPSVSNPKLWSTSSPNLYEVKTQLLDGATIIDEKTETIGYRWYKFDDYGAGANFLRLGHYPQDPTVYETCNKLGIIVWDELPWCRGGMGTDQWQANTERLLEEQIQQNHNHPSILFWSLGNEIYWLPDFENGDDKDMLNNYVSKLNDLAHKLDDSRMTAIRKYYAGSDLVDVFSPSIWSGWYAGVYTNYGKTLKENQKKYKRFLHMEYGGSSHVGRHTENPISGDGSMNEDDWAEVANQVNIKNIAKTGDWTENYIVDLFDWYLGITETSEDLTGNAQWAFKDFGTPLRPENAIPYLNQKGLVDRDGNPKDAYYVFKSYWSDDPFTYIESHTWTERRGPKDKARNVSVFSNCESVELFQNGKSLGKKNRVLGEFPACGLNWDVVFTQGKNELSTIGYKDGKKIADDKMVVNYEYQQADKADHIDLTYKKLDNGNYLVEAFMKDKNGNRVLDYEKHLYFSRDGEGKLLKDYGTPTRSQVIQMANGYAAIELQPATSGRAIIEARNQDFKGSYLTINFETIKD